MRFSLFLCAVLLLSCASTATIPTRYLLPAEVPAGTAMLDPPVWIGLGRIDIPPYLGERGIVVETGDGQVRAARQHLWAEPLDEGLRRFLRIEIANAIGHDVSSDATERAGWDITVDIRIDRFHGNLSGEALLMARWRVTRKAGEDPARYRFSAIEPLARPGYPGLVDSEVLLARQLARAIAESVAR